MTGTLFLYNNPVPTEAGDTTGADDLDDYDDAAHVADPTPPAPHVVVEAAGDGFEVARMRDDGTSVARVLYTRNELVELIIQCRAAIGEPW